MSFKTIEEGIEMRKQVLQKAKDLADLAIKENRSLTAEEKQTAENMILEAKNLKDSIMEMKSNQGLLAQIKDLTGDFELSGNPESQQDREQKGTIGERFTKDATWLAYFKQIAANGRIPNNFKGLNSPSIQFKDLITGLGDTSAGAFIVPQQTGIVETLGRYPLNVRDLISVRSTNSDTVEYVRQTKQITEAATVPESNVTNYTGATGQVSGQKPEGGLNWVRVSESVKTLAVWVAATKMALSDAAQLRGIIDSELRDDLAEELENQIINGDGVGENFTGITNTSNVLIQPFVTDLFATTRKAITNLAINGKARPTAWLMNPQDWEAVELTTNESGNYFYGGPISRGQMQLWGIPVLTSYFLAPGSAILADFKKAILWNRQQTSITVSDSHEDFFTRNMVAILGEMRAAFGVTKPSSFVEVDLQSGS